MFTEDLKIKNLCTSINLAELPSSVVALAINVPYSRSTALV